MRLPKVGKVTLPILASSFGIAIALATILLISSFILSEVGFDSWIDDHERTGKLNSLFYSSGTRLATVPAPVHDFLPNFAPGEVEGITRLKLQSASVHKDGTLYNEGVFWGDPNFFDIVRISVIHGDTQPVLEGSNAVITATAAIKYFGRANAVGETITIQMPDGSQDFRIVSVIPEWPSNTHFTHDFFIPMQTAYLQKSGNELSNWNWYGTHTYVRVKEPSSFDRLNHSIGEFIDLNIPPEDGQKRSESLHYGFTPIAEVHLEPADLYALKPRGDRTQLQVFAGIGLLIFLAVALNSIFLTTVDSLIRLRLILMKKIHGANRLDIIGSILWRTLVFSIPAFPISIFAHDVLRGILFHGDKNQGGTGIELEVILVAVIVAFVSAIISSIFSFLRIDRVRPAELLRTKTVSGFGVKARLATLLLVVQFTVSLSVMTLATIVYVQTSHLKNLELGYDPENLVAIKMWDIPNYHEHTSLLSDRIALLPGVKDVGVVAWLPGQNTASMAVRVVGRESSNPIPVSYQGGDSNLLGILGIKPMVGRELMRDFPGDLLDAPTQGDNTGTANILANESAVRALGFTSPDDAIGSTVIGTGTWKFQLTIVGVVPDFRFEPSDSIIQPRFFINWTYNQGVVLARLQDGQAFATLEQIDQIWRQTLPEFAINRVQVSSEIESTFSDAVEEANLLIFFSFIATGIALTGFLALFRTAQAEMRKSAAIRKCFGASRNQILVLALRRWVKPLALSTILAIPIGSYFGQQWLSQYVERINIGIMELVIPILVLLAVTVSISLYDVLKISNERPSNVLRAE